jgi:hypothetical protein
MSRAQQKVNGLIHTLLLLHQSRILFQGEGGQFNPAVFKFSSKDYSRSRWSGVPGES